jgi:hypothetical protein
MVVPDNEVGVFEYIKNFLVSYKVPIFRQNYRISSAYEFCAREWVLDELFHDELYEQVDWLSKLYMARGSVMHKVIQNQILGPAGILWHKWACTKCGKIYDGFMPREVCECSASCKDNCIWVGDKTKRICQFCPKFGRYDYIEPEMKIVIGNKELIGHTDGILKFNIDTKEVTRLLEIKSIASRLFAQLSEPYESHFAQANLYMHLLNIKQASILYIDRGLSVMPILKEYIVEYDKELAESIISNIRNGDLVVARAKGIKFEDLPVRVCDTKDDFRAKKCPYRDKCFNDELLIRFFKNKIKEEVR